MHQRRNMTKEQQETHQKLKRIARRYGQGKMAIFAFFIVEGVTEKGEVQVARVAQFRPAPYGHAVLQSMSNTLQEHGPIIQKELDELNAKSKEKEENGDTKKDS